MVQEAAGRLTASTSPRHIGTGLPPALDELSLRFAVSLLGRQDCRLAGIIDRYGVPPLWSRRPGFATLLRIILEQQVSLASARSLYRRLGTVLPRVTPAGVRGLGAAGLQQLGFTSQKANYACHLAERLLQGELRLQGLRRYPDDRACKQLMTVTGIGPWTANIYLLMALRRPDVWPPGDLALQKAVTRLEGLSRLPSLRVTEGIAARWRPWRAVAARILWHGYLSERVKRGASSVAFQP